MNYINQNTTLLPDIELRMVATRTTSTVNMLENIKKGWFYLIHVKKNNKVPHNWALCEGNPPVTGWPSSLRAGDMESGSMSWRYHKNRERHTAHTIVSWPNPKLLVIVHTSDLMMIIRQSIYIYIYILSIITREMGKLKAHSPTYNGQATGLDAWASRVKCPARFVSHLHDIYIYIYELFIAFVCFVVCALL